MPEPVLEDYVLIRRANGSEGHVLESDFTDPEKADYFRDAKIVSRADGTDYKGPTTVRGIAARAEREGAAEAPAEAPKGKAGE